MLIQQKLTPPVLIKFFYKKISLKILKSIEILNFFFRSNFKQASFFKTLLVELDVYLLWKILFKNLVNLV